MFFPNIKFDLLKLQFLAMILSLVLWGFSVYLFWGLGGGWGGRCLFGDFVYFVFCVLLGFFSGCSGVYTPYLLPGRV